MCLDWIVSQMAQRTKESEGWVLTLLVTERQAVGEGGGYFHHYMLENLGIEEQTLLQQGRSPEVLDKLACTGYVTCTVLRGPRLFC